MGPMEAALDVFAELVTREAKKGEKDSITAVYTALMAACEKVLRCASQLLQHVLTETAFTECSNPAASLACQVCMAS